MQRQSKARHLGNAIKPWRLESENKARRRGIPTKAIDPEAALFAMLMLSFFEGIEDRFGGMAFKRPSVRARLAPPIIPVPSLVSLCCVYFSFPYPPTFPVLKSPPLHEHEGDQFAEIE